MRAAVATVDVDVAGATDDDVAADNSERHVERSPLEMCAGNWRHLAVVESSCACVCSRVSVWQPHPALLQRAWHDPMWRLRHSPTAMAMMKLNDDAALPPTTPTQPVAAADVVVADVVVADVVVVVAVCW